MSRAVTASLASISLISLLWAYDHGLHVSGAIAAEDAAGAGGGVSAVAGAKDGTYTGDVKTHNYGDVQVKATVAGGKITAVDVVKAPTGDPVSKDLTDKAVPKLVSETIAAQSAKVQAFSGATLTSNAYMASLQSALDKSKQ